MNNTQKTRCQERLHWRNRTTLWSLLMYLPTKRNAQFPSKNYGQANIEYPPKTHYKSHFACLILFFTTRVAKWQPEGAKWRHDVTIFTPFDRLLLQPIVKRFIFRLNLADFLSNRSVKWNFLVEAAVFLLNLSSLNSCMKKWRSCVATSKETQSVCAMQDWTFRDQQIREYLVYISFPVSCMNCPNEIWCFVWDPPPPLALCVMSGPVHTGRVSRFSRKVACKSFDVACNAVWTLQLATMCSIFCVQHLRAPLRPVWTGPKVQQSQVGWGMGLVYFVWCHPRRKKPWAPVRTRARISVQAPVGFPWRGGVRPRLG